MRVRQKISNDQAQARLDALYAEIESQVEKLPLASKPEDIVPGEGVSSPSVLCIGEAPGRHEAEQRRPFVGRSGQLLRKLLAEAGLTPDTLYIANIVKVRPPENRDPSLDEIEAYKPFLEREIEILAPDLIVTLGRFSMAMFLPDAKISQVHGRLQKVTYILHEKPCIFYVLPLYHPAAGLRNGKVLTAFKEDIAKIPSILEWINVVR